MLDYSKMDDVLNNLATQADELKSLSTLQAQFESALAEVKDAIQIINNESERTESAASAILSLESAHRDINDKLETALHNYKILHSSFEYLEIELKKLSASTAEMQSGVTTISQNLQTATADISSQAKRTKRNSIGIFATIGFSIVTLIVSIIGLVL